MNSNIVIVVVVQFILACVPLNGQAAALDRDNDPEQLFNIGWELSQDCLNHRDPIRMKNNRQALFRNRERVLTRRQQSDLLRELLSPRDVRYKSNQMTEEIEQLQIVSYKNKEQDTRILDELLVETSIP